VAIALVITIGGLVFKPWTLLGPLGAGPAGNAPAGGPEGTSGQPTVGLSSPQGAPSSGFAVGSSALGGVGPGASASPGLTPRAFLEDLRPIEPDTWAHISASLRRIDRNAVVFVARWPGGLYWRFVPVEPGERQSLTEPVGSSGADPSAEPDTVRITGYLATPLAIGLARPAGEPAPWVIAWQVFGPGATLRLPLRHPVGDLDRFLFLGPGLDMPRGEQTNRREISRFPPSWLEGVYRFDLTGADGPTRHVFVVLEPDASH